MGHPDRVIGDVDHGRVFNFVDRVPANVGHLSLLSDQHDVVALQKTHKPCQKMSFSFIFFNNLEIFGSVTAKSNASEKTFGRFVGQLLCFSQISPNQ